MACKYYYQIGGSDTMYGWLGGWLAGSDCMTRLQPRSGKLTRRRGKQTKQKTTTWLVVIIISGLQT